MDIRTLPDRERGIYNRIRQDYKLTFDKLSVRDKTIRLLKVADLREFLGGNAELEKFDMIAGAEVLFRDEFFEPLLNVFKTYIKPEGTIWLAHDVGRKSLPKFLDLAKKDFDIPSSVANISTFFGSLLFAILTKDNRAYSLFLVNNNLFPIFNYIEYCS